MNPAQARSELQRMFPTHRNLMARVTAGDIPGWRCQVAVWKDCEGFDGTGHYHGHGETFEGAIADLEHNFNAPNRVDQAAHERRQHPRAVDSIVTAFHDLPPTNA